MSSSAVSILSGGAAVTQPRGSRGRGPSLPAGRGKREGGEGRREKEPGSGRCGCSGAREEVRGKREGERERERGFGSPEQLQEEWGAGEKKGDPVDAPYTPGFRSKGKRESCGVCLVGWW